MQPRKRAHLDLYQVKVEETYEEEEKKAFDRTERWAPEREIPGYIEKEPESELDLQLKEQRKKLEEKKKELQSLSMQEKILGLEQKIKEKEMKLKKAEIAALAAPQPPPFPPFSPRYAPPPHGYAQFAAPPNFPPNFPYAFGQPSYQMPLAMMAAPGMEPAHFWTLNQFSTPPTTASSSASTPASSAIPDTTEEPPMPKRGRRRRRQ